MRPIDVVFEDCGSSMAVVHRGQDAPDPADLPVRTEFLEREVVSTREGVQGYCNTALPNDIANVFKGSSLDESTRANLEYAICEMIMNAAEHGLRLAGDRRVGITYVLITHQSGKRDFILGVSCYGSPIDFTEISLCNLSDPAEVCAQNRRFGLSHVSEILPDVALMNFNDKGRHYTEAICRLQLTP